MVYLMLEYPRKKPFRCNIYISSIPVKSLYPYNRCPYNCIPAVRDAKTTLFSLYLPFLIDYLRIYQHRDISCRTFPGQVFIVNEQADRNDNLYATVRYSF